MMLKILLLSSLIFVPVKEAEVIKEIEPVKIDLIIFDMETHKIVETIKQKETRGRCNAKGGSGEFSCWQIMPPTWRSLTKKHLGEVKGYSTTTAELVVYKEIQDLQLKKLTPKQIFQIWNQGTYKKPCVRGVNSWGVRYDSCQYVKESMAIYNKL